MIGITHAEITEIAFIRSVARFFYDTRIHLINQNHSKSVNEEEYFTNEYNVDDIYELAYPEYNSLQVAFYSLPLKFIIDSVITQNILVDFDDETKQISAAHFDSEQFVESSKRILRLRQSSKRLII